MDILQIGSHKSESVILHWDVWMSVELKPINLPSKDDWERARGLLKELQKKLLPAHENDWVTIRPSTLEYIIGASDLETGLESRKRWPDELSITMRLNGKPAVKFH